ncbi:MAG TPA: AAA family ATPase, partial [Fimbriimonadaceae bacterium]|nr:AAA family ATPase [Fimbriimonadaceae bacterium]
GLQQTLLLLAYIYDNPGSVLLLDEPDAHLEVLRQRHTFQLIREIAAEQGAQIIAASHSEVVLNEAASTGKLVAFIGRPHTLTDKPSQLIKALTDIGWEHYYEAELKGWVLYVEDASDLLVLKELAKLLDHPASTALENSYVHYISTNVPVRAREHFFGLQEAKPDLVGIALFDRIDKPLQSQRGLEEVMWSKREIENYFCRPEVLLRWVRHNGGRDLFALAEADDAEPQMNRAVDEVAHALQVLGKDPWGSEVKASEEVLDAIFRLYYQLVGSPIVFRKAQYFQLVPFLTPEEVDPEVSAVLDRILAVSKLARPPE